MESLRINGESPTRVIQSRLRPYWKARALDDQDWAMILLCLRKIELKCPFCMGRGVCHGRNPETKTE